MDGGLEFSRSFEVAAYPLEGLKRWDEQPQERIYCMVFQETTEFMRREEMLLREAFYDRLTGLPNRAYFEERFNESLVRIKDGESRRLSIFLLDIDDFKAVNDIYGHEAGDRILVQAGRRLTECVRKVDVVCRWGGDEFVVMVEARESEEAAEQIAGRIRSAFSRPFVVGNRFITLGCSIGGIVRAERQKDLRSLVRKADEAMYQAKRAGRSRIVAVSTHKEA